MLTFLLSIFDEEGGFYAAIQARARHTSGCLGLAYGGKPHILNAMEILAQHLEQGQKLCQERRNPAVLEEGVYPAFVLEPRH